MGAVDIVRMGQERSVRDITVNARDSEHGRPRVHSPREILDAIFYVLRTGCQPLSGGLRVS